MDANFHGYIEHSNLPVRRGLSLDIAFFAVPTIETPPPFDGDPPGDAVTDCHNIYKLVDWDRKSLDVPLCDSVFRSNVAQESSTFSCVPCYIAITTTKHVAQAEQFFFASRPLQIAPDLPSVTLPMAWPDIPLEELGHYGTVKPDRKRPWPLSWFSK